MHSLTSVLHFPPLDPLHQDEFPILFFRGRRDQQIKIRGNRVELLEVESQLLQTGSVSSACVTSWGNPPRDIVAYITPLIAATEHQVSSLQVQ
jgi:acyl-coenzyme A synthetase/AMP-(fatty) acid ligase